MTEKCLNENGANDPASDARARQIRENVALVQEKIAAAARKAGRAPQEITLVAVTKTMPAQDVNVALSCGIDVMGENRVQELLSKWTALELQGKHAHIIGHLQSNKVRQIIDKVEMIQSLDSLKLAAEIDAQAQKHGLAMPVLVEVNIGGEESKSGVRAQDLPEFLDSLAPFSHIRVHGLMTIPPAGENPELARSYFRQMRKLFIDNAGKKSDNMDMHILSMGMSADYDIAVEEGATMVRVGTALFGKR